MYVISTVIWLYLTTEIIYMYGISTAIYISTVIWASERLCEICNLNLVQDELHFLCLFICISNWEMKYIGMFAFRQLTNAFFS